MTSISIRLWRNLESVKKNTSKRVTKKETGLLVATLFLFSAVVSVPSLSAEEMQEIRFVGTSMDKVSWTEFNKHRPDMGDLNWQSVQWSQMNWNEMNLSEIENMPEELADLDWSQMDWENFDFSEVEIEGQIQTELEQLLYMELFEFGLNPYMVNWKNVDLSQIDLSDLDLTEIDLKEMDLDSVDFESIDVETDSEEINPLGFILPLAYAGFFKKLFKGLKKLINPIVNFVVKQVKKLLVPIIGELGFTILAVIGCVVTENIYVCEVAVKEVSELVKVKLTKKFIKNPTAKFPDQRAGAGASGDESAIGPIALIISLLVVVTAFVATKRQKQTLVTPQMAR